MSTSTSTMMWSADAISEALGQEHRPTPEQRAIIEASPAEPLLVVAGAGSGKTETMTARVVWLVANGHVEADQVLGLTFTRKAAAELSERLTERLAHLERAGIWSPAGDDDAEALGGTPTVSTYHSYAGRLVREHALRLGYETDSRLLTEAAAWQYAHQAVLSYDGDMRDVTRAESTLTNAVVDLSGEMAEHLVGVPELAAHLDELVATLEAVPITGKAKTLGDGAKVLADLRERRQLLPIIERYQSLKRAHDAMDFADQMALAAQLARSFPDIGAGERSRFRAVLLDEFQDTSEAQMVLMSALFASGSPAVPVAAVGDPNQSIYAWRGASATTLSRFPEIFRASDSPAQVLSLTRSWRNDHLILDAANEVATPLRRAATVAVAPLTAADHAGQGAVSVARLETARDEADHVAAWIAERRRGGAASAAVLCRKRSQFPAVMEALAEREIPFEVVGLGGLLLTSEVEDLVALLHVVQDPSRGDQLMRLLTGPALRLGAADLDGLAEWAKELRRRQIGGHPGQRAGRGAEGEAVDQAPDSADDPSIVEALEHLPAPDWASSDGRRISALALDRLAGLGEVVRRLRRLTGLPLADLVGEAERELSLDIEVLARPGYTPAAARAHLDAFADVAASFSVSAERPTLGGFLAWLTAAVEEERGLDKGTIEVTPGAVQVLTVHAAKGLEWDVVAVPGLIEASFPEHSAKGTTWAEGDWVHGSPSDKAWLTGVDSLPYGLRGDQAGLPSIDLAADDQQDLKVRLADFTRRSAEQGITEERRLAYVALTRARHHLLLSSSVWAGQKTPRVTSRFLRELVEAVEAGRLAGLAVRTWTPMPQEPDVSPPDDESVVSATWPVEVDDPRLGRLRSAARAVAGAVADVAAGDAAVRDPAEGPDGTRGDGEMAGRGIDREITLLLAERDLARGPRHIEVMLPEHLSTSAMVALARDREAFTADLRRPMPTRPDPAARRGTAFHAWLEQHYGSAAIVDVLDLPGSADDDPGLDEDFPRLRETFLASPWATRTPLELEVAVETVIAGLAVRGRIDAVFPDRGPDGEEGVVIVDWKTGRPPSGAEADIRALQLAAYRIAYARLTGRDPERVRAAFYFAPTGETVWPTLRSEEELAALLTEWADGPAGDGAPAREA
ncbi:ATP-dependent helicase [Janibacter sp. G56]|uniref:ATP-dependent helicase n=1 Tax=Janibacter sp. G56 TaxID=3418717 RepID=UPI003D01E075